MNIEAVGADIEHFTFPGGEEHVRVYGTTRFSGQVVANIKNSSDVMTLLLVVDALRRDQCEIFELLITYFPYARQDRVCSKGEALGVKVMADLINSLEIPVVAVRDPHSDVVAALLDNCVVFPQWMYVEKIVKDDQLLICPDAGAEKKILKLQRPYVMATKVRDVETGNIIDTKVYEPERVNERRCVIVDDICDGGRTFIELAKVLKEHGATHVHLHVTHGIFSKGLDVLRESIDKVTCVEGKDGVVCKYGE